MMINKRLVRGRISISQLASLSVIFFFCNPLIEIVCTSILSKVGLSNFSEWTTVFVVYIPLTIALILAPMRFAKLDFLVLLVGIVLFFLLTFLFHPEYAYWYARPDYGVWNYVLFPINGLYAYLFARTEPDPIKLKADMKIAGWLMYVYFTYQIILANRRGYWIGVAGSNGAAEFTYSVSFGYNVLFYLLVFMYDALTKRKKIDFIASGMGLVMVFSYGSRGPILFLAMFLAVMFYLSLKTSKKSTQKLLTGTLLIIALLLIYLFYDFVLGAIIALLSKLNISSRFIAKMLDGSIASDSGRSVIWEAARQMICENPLGYGAMGSQHVIAKYIYAGYPHNVFLEMCIDFGVVVGPILFGFLMIRAIKICLSSKDEWRGIFLPIFCTGCALFLSLCFWSNKAFWTCIGIGVSYYSQERKKGEISEREGKNGSFSN